MSSQQLDSDHLHLGCGLKAPAGWLNVDGSWQVVLARHPWLKKILVASRLFPRKQAAIPWSHGVKRLDLTKPLPFPDGIFAVVYSSHTLEHLYHEDALALLRQSHRVLKPGGICRAVVPDLESMVLRYVQAKQADKSGAGTRFMEELLVHDKAKKRGLMGLYYRLTAFHQHKWMYDAASMQEMFLAAGFKQVGRAECFESRIQRIAEVEDAGRILEGQGVAVEGVKE